MTCIPLPRPKGSLYGSTAPRFRSPARRRTAPVARRTSRGEKKQNTRKAVVISDRQRRCLRLGAIRLGRMHDVIQVRTEGIEGQLRLHPNVRAEVHSEYTGLARDFPGQVSDPPKKPGQDAGLGERNLCADTRHRQSQRRIMVEHTIAEPKQWRSLQRWTGQRQDLPEVREAVRGLVSDRAVKRATVHQPGTDFVLAGPTAC
ncbi:transposase family protein [Streptomyces sp. NPDC006622]|uniref:transposase family protein n=1 Tax=Streptomyces sp. NPDC006622 TaxID=3155459 RepID=UPI0033BC4D64